MVIQTEEGLSPPLMYCKPPSDNIYPTVCCMHKSSLLSVWSKWGEGGGHIRPSPPKNEVSRTFAIMMYLPLDTRTTKFDLLGQIAA
jgi:hypothetical protein